MKYQIIYIDPPWKYGCWDTGSSKSCFSKKYNEKSIPMPYKQMDIQDIKKLDINSLADNNCELYMWITQKYLPYFFDVINSWGFKYCQTLIWCKKPMGKGQGGVFCPTNEFLILGRIGKMPNVKRVDTTWFEVKRTNKHSKKPYFFRDLISHIYGDVKKVEVFAREKAIGWDSIGYDIDGLDIKESIKLLNNKSF